MRKSDYKRDSSKQYIKDIFFNKKIKKCKKYSKKRYKKTYNYREDE